MIGEMIPGQISTRLSPQSKHRGCSSSERVMGGFPAVAHGFNGVAVPYSALSATLMLVSILFA